jgi:hypothetical protein
VAGAWLQNKAIVVAPTTVGGSRGGNPEHNDFVIMLPTPDARAGWVGCLVCTDSTTLY